ncbi:hypothetical protein MRX96_007728 [Rhipicephalus microplus]
MRPASNVRSRAAPTSRWVVARLNLGNELTNTTASEVATVFRAITLPLTALGVPPVPLKESVIDDKRKIYPVATFALFAYAIRLLVAISHPVVALIVTVVLGGTHGDDLEPVPEALKFLTRFRRPVIIPYRGFLKMNQGSSNRRKPSVATGLNILN